MTFPSYDSAQTLNDLAELCARESDERWWRDLRTGEPIDRNQGELFMLIVSEVSEAMEAARKDAMDEHLPHRKGVEVELADALIRIFDLAGHAERVFGHKIDLIGAFVEKLQYNRIRADHKKEARLAENGKRY